MKLNSRKSGALFAGFAIFLFGFVVSSTAFASIVIDTTRVVYPEKDAEVSVRLANKGDEPRLVQAWIDDGDEKSNPEKIDVPFIILTPIFRMDSKKEQVLRIRYTNSKPLPKDRESVFWLNILEIPPKPSAGKSMENYLQFSFRTRIKLFLRPQNLPGIAADAPTQLTWKYQPGALLVSNPSAFNITIRDISVGDHAEGGRAESIFLAPFSVRFIALKDEKEKLNSPILKFSAINDFGGAPERNASSQSSVFSVMDERR